MNDLIEALTIMKEYIPEGCNLDYPTHCEHDILTVAIDPSNIPKDVLQRLDELGFFPDDELDVMSSFRFGSC